MNYTFSIITATFNSASTIRDCLDSVKNQQANVEHIIIDGGSNDNVLDIVDSYPHVAKVVSEPDHGIYDAMNKGISFASGEIIGILNSDDYYADSEVLAKVVEVFSNKEVDSCYGDLVYVDSVKTSKIIRKWKSGVYKERSFYWGWMPPHPTFFVRRSVYQKYGLFNLDLGSAADYELMLRFLLKNKITTSYIPSILVKMRAGGVSNASLTNRLNANNMDRKAWEVNGLNPYPWTTYVKPLRKIGQFFVFS
ncbi:MAG: glycosyltransferase family 2 protein [Desulfamplus sp.]